MYFGVLLPRLAFLFIHPCCAMRIPAYPPPGLLLLMLFAVPAFAQTPEPRPEDVASPLAIVEAAYASIARAPGADYDWERFRSLFLPRATLISNTEQTGGAFIVRSPEEFVNVFKAATNIGGPNDKGFAEESIHNIVSRYGDIANVMSSYQKHFWNDDRILGRGVNSFQVVYHDGRWWIVSIIWDEENGAGPIPPQYLGQQ